MILTGKFRVSAEDQLDQIGKYILGVVMWGNRTANPNLSAFAQFPNLDISGDKIVAHGHNLKEVVEEAKKNSLGNKFLLARVPSEETMIF